MNKHQFEILFHHAAEQELLHLPKKLQARILRILEMMEKLKKADLGMPYTKAIGNGIFEVRAKSDKNIARSLFCYFEENRLIILHTFVKKSQKIPKIVLGVVENRRKEVKDGKIKLI